MDVSNLLSYDPPLRRRTPQMPMDPQMHQQRYHQYPTRQSMSTQPQTNPNQRYTTPPANLNYTGSHSGPPTPYNASPLSPTPKHVAFELIFEESPNYRARLPMRVQIFPHDTTDSIVTTVKNFYGLYEGAAQGVSFEDEQGNTLIARYENLRNNMVVYVRVIPDYSHPPDGLRQRSFHSASPVGPHKVPHLDDAPQMLPPQLVQGLHHGQPASRPGSRLARVRSVSPASGRGRRSVSTQKGRSRSGIKSRGSSAHGSFQDVNSDPINGDSSSDGGQASVTSSRKAKSEQLASAEISLDNILEGGRRKRAKFESSELPLFVPPQVPMTTSISSVSPQRRTIGQEGPSPFARPSQRTFAYNQPLQSPQSFGLGEQGYGFAPQAALSYTTPSTASHGHRLRDRSSFPPARPSNSAIPRANAPGILPTPDPTIASCISDEDVALQLMRLGDASNLSHGRTSASTLDDALSGAADVASSATSESGNESDNTEQPSLPRQLQPGLEPSAVVPLGLIKNRHKHLSDILPSFDSTEPSGDEGDGDYELDRGALKSEPDEKELVSNISLVWTKKICLLNLVANVAERVRKDAIVSGLARGVKMLVLALKVASAKMKGTAAKADMVATWVFPSRKALKVWPTMMTSKLLALS
ncbi:MAG: hypothetical protein M1830_003170 [Pleopsidium flavum]|nr:MAG: hypothetical protein M1830_003170 [Pleopsidium flavum]